MEPMCQIVRLTNNKISQQIYGKYYVIAGTVLLYSYTDNTSKYGSQRHGRRHSMYYLYTKSHYKISVGDITYFNLIYLFISRVKFP